MDTNEAPPLTLAARLSHLLTQRRGAALIALIAVLLLVPGLGRFGLWDPQEISKVDAARDVAGAPWMTIPERHARPPVPLLVLASGIRFLGTTEVAVRLPSALLGLCTLALLYLLGTFVAGRRAGALSALVLLTVPTFFLGARQATVHLPAILSQLLCAAGLLLVIAPRPSAMGPGLGRAAGVLLAALGGVLGFFSSGAPLGLCAPLFSVALAAALCEDEALALPATLLLGMGTLFFLPPLRLLLVQAQLPLSTALRLGLAGGLVALGAACLLLGRGRRGALPGVVLLCLGAGLVAALPAQAHGYAPWLGGYLRWPPSRDVQIDSVLKPLGFQLFPWCALLPLSLAAALQRGASAPGARDRLLALLPLCWFMVTYLLATYQGALSQETPFPAIGILALSVGVYLDGLFTGDRGSPAAGLVAGLLCVLVGRDLFLFPEQYGNAHFVDTLRWPAPLTWVSPVIVNASLVFGAVLGVGMALSGRARGALLSVSLVLALLFSFAGAYGLVPLLSQHVSYRGIFTRYKQLGGSALGVYAVARSGSKFYDQGSVDLASIAQVFEFLHKDPRKRAFVLVGASELAGIDQHGKQRSLSYFVIDDSNVQFLLLSNQLPAGEQDRNPLRRLVLSEAPTPQIPLRATFEDKIELLGYDLPKEIVRGQDFVARLYFKVLKPVGGDYKVFLHIEGGGNRVNGDHSPIDGKFPTTYWVPGYYVIDEHKMSTSRVGQPAGAYQVLMGLWPGGSGVRLKVTSGPQDGDNRVKLGAVRVK